MSENRFYENEFPEAGESVVVKVLRLETTMGAYVALLEYGKMEGLILPNELSKRRFRSIHKLIKVGRQEVVSVVRVDADKGYVDLSKKRVAPEDIAATEQRFSNAKKVQLTVRQVASKLDLPILEINSKAIWPLYRKFNHAYDGLKIAASGDEAAVAKVFEGISETTGGQCPQRIIDAILEDIRPRFAPQAIKARVRIHCSCTGLQGVNAVKKALLDAEALANDGAAKEASLAAESFSLKIQLVASPLYTLIASCADKAYGLAKVQAALKTIKESITAVPGGEFKQHGEIMIFGADDEEAEKDQDSEDDDEDDSSESSSSSQESDEEAVSEEQQPTSRG